MHGDTIEVPAVIKGAVIGSLLMLKKSEVVRRVAGLDSRTGQLFVENLKGQAVVPYDSVTAATAVEWELLGGY
jgi:hypothetical protein